MDIKVINSRKLAEHLRGTCMSLDEAMEDLDLTEDDIDYETLDSEVLCCDGCGWWFEAGSITFETGYNVCSDCYDEYAESDE